MTVHESGRNYMNRFLSFAVGSILGDVFVHLLPETWELYQQYNVGHHSRIGVIIIVGILVFLLIEKFSNAADSSVEIEEPPAKSVDSIQGETRNGGNSGLRRRGVESSESTAIASSPDRVNPAPSINIEGYLNLLANVVDNFSHGLAVGGSFSVSIRIGLLTTLCILVHEIPHEMSDFVILLRAGFDRRQAAYAQLGTASSCIVGTIFALVVDSATAGLSKAYILPFTCGGFIYIALVTLVPNLTKEDDPKESLKQLCLILLGIITTSILAFCHF